MEPAPKGNFAYYAAAPAISPLKAMKRLLGERRPMRAAAEAVGFVGLLYTGTSVVLALAGAVPLSPVLVQIPPENYYFWQMFFAIPCVLLAWVLLAGLIHILGKHERSRTAFERTGALAGAALAAALLAAWVPTALETFFLVIGMNQQELVGMLSEPGGWQLLYFVLYIFSLGVAVVLLTLAAGHGQFKKGGWPRAAGVGLVATAVLAGIYVLFIR